MRSFLLAPLAAVLLLSVSACSGSRRVALPEPRPLGAEYPAYRAPLGADEQVIPENIAPVVELPLRDALSRSLLQNPNLQSFAWEVRAREVHALQAGLWPNPELSADAEEFAGTGSRTGTGAAELGIGLSQLLPLGGDVGARRRVAARERDLAGWDYEAVRLDVLTRTTQTFAAVLAAQDRLRLAGELLELARQFAQTVSDRADAGKISPLEATRAGVVRSNAEIARTRAVHDLAAARQRLASLWGRTEPAFERAVGDLTEVQPVPSLQAISELVDRNPDVARWATAMALRLADLRLAMAERIPDPVLTIGPSRFHESGETALRAGVSIPLPLFDRNQGAIREARYRIRQSEASADAARMEVERQLAETYGTLAAAYASATALEEEVLPAARETYEAMQVGYREGKFDLLAVLDAQRTLFEATNQYVDATQTYHQARAAVERLVGTPLRMIENE